MYRPTKKKEEKEKKAPAALTMKWNESRNDKKKSRLFLRQLQYYISQATPIYIVLFREFFFYHLRFLALYRLAKKDIIPTWYAKRDFNSPPFSLLFYDKISHHKNFYHWHFY